MDLSGKTKPFGGTSLPKPDHLFAFTVVIIRTQVSFEITPPVLDFCHGKHAEVQYSRGVNEPRSLRQREPPVYWALTVPIVGEEYATDLKGYVCY